MATPPSTLAAGVNRHGRRTADISGEFLAYHVNATQTSATGLGAPYDLGKGVYLQAVVVNDVGVSSPVLTLYNGPGNIIARIVTANTNVTLTFRCACDQGLQYTYSSGGALGSITLRVLPMA